MARNKQPMIPHAKQRCRQRYGVTLHADLALRIVRAIQTGQSAFVERTCKHRTVQDVTLDGVTFRAVYDRKKKALITLLPRPEGVQRVAVG